MKVLVACEFSGIIRRAFTRLGHDAWSCDIRPSILPGKHLICGTEWILKSNIRWDLIIAHPPCTHLANSGSRHFVAKRKDGRQQEAITYFMSFVEAYKAGKTKRLCIENPVGIMSSIWRKPNQVIHPWQYGHPEQKATCLWLENLPPLQWTCSVWQIMQILPKRDRERIHYLSPTANRSDLRSLTYFGWADAMASQWGCL